MLRYKPQKYNSVWIWADSQAELGNAFMRFQEHYESPNPDFKDKIFTCGQVRSWYSETYGADSYHHDWSGFNFPSSVLAPFKKGLFDPLTQEEQWLLELFKYRHDHFYVIGAQNNSVLRHELAHALYSYDKKYANQIDTILMKHKKEMRKVRQYILDKGYHANVVNDELQAYITDNDDEFIINNTDKRILTQINKIYTKFEKLHNKI